MEIKNKVFVVTGGGNGLGRELVLGILRRGGKAVAVDINQCALGETKRKADNMSKRLLTIVADITDSRAVNALPEKIMKHFDAIDGVINNAGIIQPFLTVIDTSDEIMERVFRINFFGTWNIIKTFLPYLIKRPVANIVNVSSMGGFLPVPGQSIYGASKAAVKMLSEGLASEMKSTSVTVTTVFPGALETGIKHNSGIDDKIKMEDSNGKHGNATNPQIAANKLLDAIEQEITRVYIGKDASIMNLLYRINPHMATNIAHKQINNHLK